MKFEIPGWDRINLLNKLCQALLQVNNISNLGNDSNFSSG